MLFPTQLLKAILLVTAENGRFSCKYRQNHIFSSTISSKSDVPCQNWDEENNSEICYIEGLLKKKKIVFF